MSLATKNVVSGTLSAAGNGSSGYFKNDFNFHVVATSFTGAFHLERSFDDGATWGVLSTDLLGTANTYTASVSLVLHEPEDGVLYRVVCDSRSGGSIAYRLSQPIGG